jgi:hypothetical protein
MGPVQIEDRPRGNDTVGINGVVAAVIVLLDVPQADSSSDPRPLVQLPSKSPEVGVIDQTPEISLEVSVINGVEADQGGEQSPVGLRDTLTQQIAPAGQA